MAMMLTSSALRERALTELRTGPTIPAAIAAGSALVTTSVLAGLKPGKARTIGSFVAMGAGGAAAFMSGDKTFAAAGLGAAGAGLWGLLSRG
jgi:hypothetical protein